MCSGKRSPRLPLKAEINELVERSHLPAKRTLDSSASRAVHYEQKYFVSEASIYRLLKAHDLITSPADPVIKAANEFKDMTNVINQLWQTDFTYLKITGWAGTIWGRTAFAARSLTHAICRRLEILSPPELFSPRP